MPNTPSAAPTINGVVEACLYVEDLERSVSFYQDLFGVQKEIMDEFIAVLTICPGQVFILFPRAVANQPSRTSSPAGAVEGNIPSHGGNGRMHVAFAISTEQLSDWERRLAGKSVPIEGKVHWKRGGCSLYFRDPDQHLIELITPGLWSVY